MSFPGIEAIAQYITIILAVLGALLAAFWLSLVIWAFRDMRLRSRDPFAQLLAALLVAALPFVGIFIYLILRPPESLAERYERALEEEALLQEIEERPRCPKCSRMVEGEWAMCPACHTELKKVCNICYHLLEQSWQRCPHCTAQQPSKTQPLYPELLLRSIKRGAPIFTTTSHQNNAVYGDQWYQPTYNGINGSATRRRYRMAEVNGNGKAHPIPHTYIVGDNHPTIVRTLKNEPKGEGEDAEPTHIDEPTTPPNEGQSDPRPQLHRRKGNDEAGDKSKTP